MLKTRGEQVTLRRLGSPNIDVTVWAKIDGAGEQLSGGSMPQFKRRVIISNVEIAAAGWPGPPKRMDQIITAGKMMTVQTCDTANGPTEVVRHALETLGA
jgi:hypothetical protein